MESLEVLENEGSEGPCCACFDFLLKKDVQDERCCVFELRRESDSAIALGTDAASEGCRFSFLAVALIVSA
jgi:hypothetical protein